MYASAEGFAENKVGVGADGQYHMLSKQCASGLDSVHNAVKRPVLTSDCAQRGRTREKYCRFPFCNSNETCR